MIKAVDLFLPVSRYTSEKLQTVLDVSAKKIQVLNNCLDPFLSRASAAGKMKELQRRYNIETGELVLLTLTRLKYSEQYKGYDKVIKALASVNQPGAKIKYLIVGRYDNEEKARLDSLIENSALKNNIVFAGFVPDEELAAHFDLADVYIMPSTGEGFGIVFIEALFYGKPVIAGNVDGSVDALANGEFGLLVNPDSNEEIVTAIKEILANRETYLPEEKRVMERFGYENYKNNWQKILYSNNASLKTIFKETSTVSKN